MPKMAKKVTLQLTWMIFIQNREVCFKEEGLLITYHNLRHKHLVRPKSNLTRISIHKLQGQFFVER